jgi:hypothetical protein
MAKYLPAMVLLAMTTGWIAFVQTLSLKEFLIPQPTVIKITQASKSTELVTFSVAEQSKSP